MEIKVPTSKAEMDELRAMVREQIDEDDLDNVVGGNDDIKGKGKGTVWTCPFCGAKVVCKQMMDAAKHMTKACPNNPYK